MKNLKTLSREALKQVSGGLKPVGPGTYACCIGNQCSSTVVVTTSDDLSCTTPGSVLVQF